LELTDREGDERITGEWLMKNGIMTAAFALMLAGGFAAPAAEARGPKHSPAHDAAVQKCREAYEAAAAAAHAPNGPKGAARKRAMHAAAEAKKDCIAKAPK
jgi:hypothetical protein